jgi:hypothetical protein
VKIKKKALWAFLKYWYKDMADCGSLVINSIACANSRVKLTLDT